MNQGKRAVISGNVLERTVESVLATHKYVLIADKLKKKKRKESLLEYIYSPQRYAKQVHIGQGIYQTDIYVDFYIIGVPSIPSGLIIECKWQQVEGSVDEKLPYLDLNIQQCYPSPVIVLLDGSGFKPGAINWLTQQVGKNPNLLAVYDLKSFITWANNHL